MRQAIEAARIGFFLVFFVVDEGLFPPMDWSSVEVDRRPSVDRYSHTHKRTT